MSREGWEIWVRGKLAYKGDAGKALCVFDALRRGDPFDGRGGSLTLRSPSGCDLMIMCWPQTPEWR